MENKELNINWYKELLADLRKLEFTGIVLTKWHIGKRILADFDKFGKPEYGGKRIESIARDLDVDRSDIFRCVQFASKYKSRTPFDNLSWRQVLKLLPSPKEERIKEENESRNRAISNIEIRKGDFKKVLKDLKDVDVIITDPPYPKEYLDCFSDLGRFAKEKLKEDGFLIVYSGQYHLPEVIKRLEEHLTYVWTFCLYHVGKKQLVNGVNIMCGWKPVLIFSKGKKKMRFAAYDVLVSEKREKSSHEWQQSESGVKQLVEIFSRPGELVVDPFAGSGTFLKVAKDLGRKAIGAEIS